MSEPETSPAPYRVVYSQSVRNDLKELLGRAKACGCGRQTLDAVKKIDDLLHIYPQFGEPIRDLEALGATVCLVTVPPLVLQYLLDEEHRLVSVVNPFRALPNAGFQQDFLGSPGSGTASKSGKGSASSCWNLGVQFLRHSR